MSSGGNEDSEAWTILTRLVRTNTQGPATLTFGGEPNADGTAEFRSVPIAKELAKDLVRLINVWIAKQRATLARTRLREYDCAPQPDDEQLVQFLEIKGDKHLERALKSIGASSDLHTWSAADPEVGKPRSFVLTAVAPSGHPVRFLGRLTKGKQFTGRNRIVAFLEGGRFQSLSEQSAVLIDSVFDCVEAEGHLLIFKPAGFESLFSYETSLAERAATTLSGLAPYLEPDKLVSLRANIGVNRTHLRQIAGRIGLDLGKVDPARVKLAITRCGFNVTLDVTREGLRLGFEGDDPRDLIRLLTERGVESIITGRTFIATALESVPP